MPDLQVVDLHTLTDACARRLEEEGMRPGEARLVARVLTDADARGHHSHGVELLPTYIRRIRAGGIDPRAVPSWLGERSDAVALLDARGGAGQVAMDLAARQAAETARRRGVAVVGVRNNNHVGMMAAYRHPFLASDVTGLLLNISGPSVAPPAGRRRSLGNGACCLVFPCGDADPFIADFATGIVSLGKIRHLGELGLPVPDGWLLDSDGRPSANPADLDTGGSVPVFGGHKGLCVALIIEVLAGILGGDTISPRVHKQRQEPEVAMGCSQLVIALDNRRFGLSDAAGLVGELDAAVRSAYPAAPDVYFPEQQEQQKVRAASSGVTVPPSVREELGL